MSVVQQKRGVEIVAFGEALIDRYAQQLPDGNVEVEDCFGGAPGNTAIALSRLNVRAEMIGKVGNDSEGTFIRSTFEQYGVGTEGLVVSLDEPTTIAFVTLSQEGDRSFTFQAGAHRSIYSHEVSIREGTKMIHLGSVTQTEEPAAQTTMDLIAQARRQGVTISYDPNIREPLWDDMNRARAVILETAKQVDILKVNREEALFLTGATTIEEAARLLFEANKLQLLVITLDQDGCYYQTATCKGSLPAIKVEVVDTTGAGDAFNAGLLSGLLRMDKPASELPEKRLQLVLKRAIIIASLTTREKGALNGFPTYKEIAGLLLQ